MRHGLNSAAGAGMPIHFDAEAMTACALRPVFSSGHDARALPLSRLPASLQMGAGL
jgi:hypothetical protein